MCGPSRAEQELEPNPYALRFYQRPVGFYCDGDTDFSHAQFAGRPGCRVKGVSVALFDDALIVRVDLHEDDAFGIYRYITSLYVEGARVLVFLDPLRNSAQLSYDTGQTWKDLTVIDGCQVGKHGGTAFAIVPLSLWSGYADHRTLAGSRIGFELDYVEGRRRELFFFGSGFSNPVPTLFEGSAFLATGG